MKTKHKHYIAVIFFAAAFCSMMLFILTEYTMTVIGAFFCLLISMVYRNEYHFDTLLGELKK